VIAQYQEPLAAPVAAGSDMPQSQCIGGKQGSFDLRNGFIGMTEVGSPLRAGSEGVSTPDLST
jgi:hypothetical protein